MSSERKGFWRRFTWKRMALFFLWFFFITLLVEILIDLANWQVYFTPRQLLGRFGKAAFLGFLFSLWFEPRTDGRKKSQAGDA